MTVQTQLEPGYHGVQFYERDDELAHGVGRYLADGIRAGAALIVIATPPHRNAFATELEASGLDAARAVEDGSLLLLDAADTLARFMPGGELDPRAFRAVIGGVVESAAAGGRPVRAYGEMVALLWERGDVLAAIELERMWNELGRELDFELLCAYRRDSVAGSEHASALQEVCSLHSDVIAELTAQFPAELPAVALARRFVKGALEAHGCDRALATDAQLVVSELATNAIMHADSRFEVALDHTQQTLRISVTDTSVAHPSVVDAQLDSPSGRGLRVIEALSDAWGVEARPGGKTVWAQLRS